VLTAADIRRLEREVVKFAGRITRDDWIGQAKQLLSA
jgi:predicted flap endonuclease-1-like 5' DNA nuclease